MCNICYLCGKAIFVIDESSDDHAFSKTLLKREQPKVKGFDYAGKLPTHDICNNRFGPERFVKKAIELLEILNNPNSYSKFQSVSNPDINLVVVNSESISKFSKQERDFFKVVDVQNKEYSEWSNPSYIKSHEAVNPYKIPLNTGLSVLAKSASALLVKRKNVSPDNTPWRIMAILNYSENKNIDLSIEFGTVKPFDEGIELYIKKFEESSDYFTVYKYDSIVIYMFFAFENGYKNIKTIKDVFSDQEVFLFEKDTLVELIEFDWLVHDLSKLELPSSF